ncbi:3-oxoacyl-ACP synthase III family protein [Nocardia sp. NPDC055321]
MRKTSDNSSETDCHCGCALADPGIPDQRRRAAAAVLGTGAYLPERVVTNAEVAAGAGVDPGWITERTGIGERRWAESGEATSDLATIAARRALAAAGIEPRELSAIVVSTSTPDTPQPPTAAYVQHNLGADGAWAFDVNAVCSGFVFALHTAESVIARSGGYALVIGADVYSRILNPADRRTVVLFGDGAGAVVLGPASGHSGILHTSLHTFGALSGLIRVPAGGSREPYRPSENDTGRHYFAMEGGAVREFVTERLPGLVKQFLCDAAHDPADVDHLITHQANGVMLDQVVPQLGLVNATEHRTLEEFGNTGSASIPITLDFATRTAELKRGDKILLTGFGGGMAAGLALLEW